MTACELQWFPSGLNEALGESHLMTSYYLCWGTVCRIWPALILKGLHPAACQDFGLWLEGLESLATPGLHHGNLGYW